MKYSTDYVAKIILKGNPRSTQNIYRSTCRGKFPTTYMTDEGKALKEQYQWEAKSQYTLPKLTESLVLHVYFFFGDRRVRDLDNQNKLILDALTGIVYADDNQIDELHLYRRYDKENPRVEILVDNPGDIPSGHKI